MIPWNEETKWILGRPNFTFIEIANILRKGGQEIPKRSEDEQAAGIYWMLALYDEHGDNWKEVAEQELRNKDRQPADALD